MRFLKQVEADLGTGRFLATFWNGKTTTNKTVADFFMLMQSKGENIEGVQRYIRLGKQIDLFKPWDEIEEIIKNEKH